MMDRELETEVRDGLARLADDAGEPSPDLRRRVLTDAAGRGRARRFLLPFGAVATTAAVIVGVLVVVNTREDGGVKVTPVDPGPSTASRGPEGWDLLPDAPIQARRDHVAVWTGKEMLIWGGTDGEQDFDDGAAYDPAAGTWRTIPAAPIEGRADASAAWTGDRMLVWGGSDLTDGAELDPATGQWTKLPKSPLVARLGSTTVWTGQEMIVWGGENVAKNEFVDLADGAAYDPVERTWRKIAPGPSAREEHTAVWTGSHMIVWGGRDELEEGEEDVRRLADGAAYDPKSDEWTELPPAPISARNDHAAAVWTGDVMFVWGGMVDAPVTGPYNAVEAESRDGATYDPDAKKWSGTGDVPAMLHSYVTAVWTGREVVLWGGSGGEGGSADGAAFDPDTRTWRATAPSPLTGRTGHTAVWTGDKMLVWGGSKGELPVADGAAYDPGSASDAGPATTVPDEDEGPGTGRENACAGDFAGRGAEGVRAFVDAFYATRVRGATGVEDCITTEVQQEHPSIVGQCVGTKLRERSISCAIVPLKNVEVRQADANSWEVTVTRGDDCASEEPSVHVRCFSSVMETLFLGPGRNLEGEQRALVVRGITPKRPADQRATTSSSRSS